MVGLLIKGLGAFVGYLLSSAVKGSLVKYAKGNATGETGIGVAVGAVFFLLGWFLGKKLSGIAGDALEGLAIGGVVAVATEVYNYAVASAKKTNA